MRRILFSLAVLFLATPLLAGWSRAGLHGADVRALALDNARPDTIFLGTSQGEIYVSHDGAVSWKNPRGGVPFPGYVVDNLLIDRSGRLWAACWGLWGGGVIAVSDDGGVSWTRRDLNLEEFSVRAIAADPGNADTLVVGGLTGVYRTRDGGRKWKKISDQINVESLAVDPRDPDVIYVGTWRQAFRTDDGGDSWTLINNGMVLDTDVFSITIDPNDPDNLWASTCGWVYNSRDRGNSWLRFRDGFNNRRIHDIELDPQNPRCILAGSVAGLYRSSNLGRSWELVSADNMVINALAVHPERPGRIIIGTEGDGIYLSCDDGKSYTRSSLGLHNVRVAEVVPDPRLKGRLYAAVFFGGAASGIYRSDDHGTSWDKINKTKLPEVLSLLVRSDVAPMFVAGTEQGFFWSADGIDWTQAEPSTSPTRVEKVLAYNDLRLFAATTEGVFTSKDSGKSWYRLAASKDRTVDIAVGRVGENRALYALTAGGLFVFDGAQWDPVFGSPSKGRTLAIRDGTGVDTVVVAGTDGVAAGHVDFLKQWHSSTAPAIAQASVYESQQRQGKTVYLSSREKERLFIAGEGASWRSIGLPMRVSDIGDVAGDPFDSSRLYVATEGEGIFVYDDEVEPLRPSYASESYLEGGSK